MQDPPSGKKSSTPKEKYIPKERPKPKCTECGDTISVSQFENKEGRCTDCWIDNENRKEEERKKNRPFDEQWYLCFNTRSFNVKGGGQKQSRCLANVQDELKSPFCGECHLKFTPQKIQEIFEKYLQTNSREIKHWGPRPKYFFDKDEVNEEVIDEVIEEVIDDVIDEVIEDEEDEVTDEGKNEEEIIEEVADYWDFCCKVTNKVLCREERYFEKESPFCQNHHEKYEKREGEIERLFQRFLKQFSKDVSAHPDRPLFFFEKKQTSLVTISEEEDSDDPNLMDVCVETSKEELEKEEEIADQALKEEEETIIGTISLKSIDLSESENENNDEEIDPCKIKGCNDPVADDQSQLCNRHFNHRWKLWIEHQKYCFFIDDENNRCDNTHMTHSHYCQDHFDEIPPYDRPSVWRKFKGKGTFLYRQHGYFPLSFYEVNYDNPKKYYLDYEDLPPTKAELKMKMKAKGKNNIPDY